MTKCACAVDGCKRDRRKREWCDAHYSRWRAYGDPMGCAVRLTAEDRFWTKVDKTAQCWVWKAGTTTAGNYGIFHPATGRSVRAHRYAYELLVDMIPEGMQLDHLCHNPRCVRPDHLRLTTNKQNNEHRLGPTRANQSGALGVSWHRGACKWQAHVMHNYKSIYLGLFATVGEAESAVVAKRLELFTHNDRDRV